MTAIDGLGGIGVGGPRGPVKSRPRANAPTWTGVTESEPDVDNAAQAGGGVPIVGLDGLLALQESVGQTTIGEPERDRRAREQGRQLLSALAGLQHLMLGDGDPAPVLDQLRALATDEPELPADPALADVLGAIRLRVRIELVRRGL